MELNTDIIIFIFFLALTLITGFLFSSRSTSFSDYALGNRNFSTATLAATISATYLGGDNFAMYIQETYKNGLYFIASAFAALGCFLLLGLFFAPRMKEFLGEMSIASAMGSLFGQHARMITAICGILGDVSMVAIQFKVSAEVLGYFLGISNFYSTIFSSCIVIFYSAFGGIRAVAFTDVIQFLTFSIVLPMIIYIIWHSMDNPAIVYETLNTHPLLDPNMLIDYNNPKFWPFVSLSIMYFIPGFSPTTFQRFSLGKNIKQIRDAYLISAVVVLVVQLLICCIAILLMAENPNLDPNNLLNHVINSYPYEGFKGLVIIGVMAMVMSSADSGLNAASVMFTNDLLKPLNLIKPDYELAISRIFLVFIGCVAVVLVFSYESLFELFLLGYSFYMPVVTMPFTMALLGFRSTAFTTLFAMLCGFTTTMIWIGYEFNGDSVTPGVIANLIGLFFFHYVFKQKGGWVGIKDYSSVEESKQDRRRFFKKIYNSIVTFNFMQYCYKLRPSNEYTYSYFGIFCMISAFLTTYSMSLETSNRFDSLVYFIYMSHLIVAAIFLTYPLWPVIFKSNNFISVAWFFALLYNLVFISTIQVLISDVGQFQLMMFLISLVVLAMLTPWLSALTMIIIGVLAGVNLFSMGFGSENIATNFGTGQFQLMYLLLLTSSILVAFVKPKQDEKKLSDEKNQYLIDQINYRTVEMRKLQDVKSDFIRNLNHAVNSPITGIISMGQALHRNYDKLSEEQRLEAVKNIAISSDKLESLLRNVINLSQLSSFNYVKDITKVDLNNLILERVAESKKMLSNKIFDEEKTVPEFVLDFAKSADIECDEHYISIVLDNLISNAMEYGQGKPIKIETKVSDDEIECVIIDQGLGIPQSEIMDIFGLFSPSSRTKNSAGNRGVGLALCKKIIEIHGGNIWATNNLRPGTSFKFILPKKQT